MKRYIKNKFEQEKEIDFKTEELYHKILDKINFDENTLDNKNVDFIFNKAKYILISIFAAILLIVTSSLTTYFILENKTREENIVHVMVNDEEYINVANEYLIEKCDFYNTNPIQTNTISDIYVFNIYKGSKFTDDGLQNYYFYQLYSLSSPINGIKVILRNVEHSFNINSKLNEVNIMGCINEIPEFLIDNYEVSIVCYNNEDLAIETKILLI